MNKIFKNELLVLLVASSNAFAVPADDQAQFLQENRQIAQAFMQRLGGTLKNQLQTGGPAGAISVCKQVAPALAKEYSHDGRQVRRVSLKTRNQALGEPDAWERAVLENFDRQKAQDAALLETSEVTQDADGLWFRYMKAIPTQAMCLQCHGQVGDIPAEVKIVLAQEYPEDRATGYRAGEIRGAITIKRKLPD